MRRTKPGAKPVKIFDGAGLSLLITPAGGRWWRFDYRFGGKRKTLSLGTYPTTSLKEAREKREVARKLVSLNIDPSADRKSSKSAAETVPADSFEAIGREWFAKFSKSWVASRGDKIIRRLERDVFPFIGTKAPDEVTAPILLSVLRKIESRGALETAHRALQNCGQVFRYAVATGRALRDPAGDLHGALSPFKGTHHASIADPARIGQLLRAMDGYEGTAVARAALRLAPLLFVRPGELRKAQWFEFNLDAAEWRIPAERMKMRAVHIVPLSRQALAALRDLEPISGTGNHVFPSIRTDKRSMSENTVNAALRRLGYAGDEMTGHGFRSMASTLLNEQGWNRDAIERQLAHSERDNVRAAYNYAEHLPERRKMMQAWADYLDGLRAGGKVVPLYKESRNKRG